MEQKESKAIYARLLKEMNEKDLMIRNEYDRTLSRNNEEFYAKCIQEKIAFRCSKCKTFVWMEFSDGKTDLCNDCRREKEIDEDTELERQKWLLSKIKLVAFDNIDCGNGEMHIIPDGHYKPIRLHFEVVEDDL